MTIEELENLYPYSCDTEAEYRVFKWIINNYKLINKRVETTNEQPNEKWFEIFQLRAGGKKRCTDESGPCSCTKDQIINCKHN